VYPREHAQLADAIVAGGGALVTEFPPGTPPLKHNFPRRNRLISGLAAGVLVVEAARDSGSLSTARHAGEQGRAVLAIPGSIHNPLTRGCHQLIREGAKLVETAADVLAELNISDMEQVVAPAKIRAGKTAELDNECEILLDAVGFDPTSIDVLVERTGFSAELVASTLLILERDGYVEPHPGGRYSRALQA
ncbi:MAG: DNA-processing protein DprA, partial [Steroidobacteraceae bacterium]